MRRPPPPPPLPPLGAACSVPSEDAARDSPNIDVCRLLYGCGFVGNAGAVVGVNIKEADIAMGMGVPGDGFGVGWNG